MNKIFYAKTSLLILDLVFLVAIFLLLRYKGYLSAMSMQILSPFLTLKQYRPVKPFFEMNNPRLRPPFEGVNPRQMYLLSWQYLKKLSMAP